MTDYATLDVTNQQLITIGAGVVLVLAIVLLLTIFLVWNRQRHRRDVALAAALPDEVIDQALAANPALGQPPAPAPPGHFPASGQAPYGYFPAPGQYPPGYPPAPGTYPGQVPPGYLPWPIPPGHAPAPGQYPPDAPRS